MILDGEGEFVKTARIWRHLAGERKEGGKPEWATVWKQADKGGYLPWWLRW